MRKIYSVLMLLALFLTACSSPDNQSSSEEMSQSVTSEAEESSQAEIVFNSSSGVVSAVKTAVLSLSPERGAGYAGFILKGDEAELMGISESGEWSRINYNGNNYYVLSSYLTESGEGTEEVLQAVTSDSESIAEAGVFAEKESSAGNAGNTVSSNVSNNSLSSNSKPAAVSSDVGNTNTSGNSSLSESSPGSLGSGSSSGNSSSSSGSSNQTASPVWHEPVYETTQVWVVDKAAWTEEVKSEVPVYETVGYIVCTCGFATTDNYVMDEHAYNHLINDEPCAYKVEGRKEITGYTTEITYIEHPEEGHYESQAVLISEGYWE